MENFQDDMQKHEKQPFAFTPLNLLTKFHNMKYKIYIKLPFVKSNVGFGSPFASQIHKGNTKVNLYPM